MHYFNRKTVKIQADDLARLLAACVQLPPPPPVPGERRMYAPASVSNACMNADTVRPPKR